jgi:hypothetical protein
MQGFCRQVLQIYTCILMSIEKKNYNRKISYQSLQKIHPKDALGLVDYAGKFLANYDG